MDDAPPLYGDPFAGVCSHTLALAPERRAAVTQGCPRCGAAEARDPAAACQLEGLAQALEALPAGQSPA